MEVDLVAQPSGPIGTLSDAGAAIVALTTESGGLDDMVTATRRFYLSRPDVKMPVLILEAPRYQPVAITCTDLALYGRSASEITLSEML